MLLIALMGVQPSSLEAQTVSKKTMDQYQQMVAMITGTQRPTFDVCRAKMESFGFTYNAAGVVDMFTTHMHPFYRMEGSDTLGFMLTTLDEKVYSIGATFLSVDPARAFPMIVKASEVQAQLAAKLGCTKYVGSVKGKVKKATYNRAELLEVLNGVEADMVSDVYEHWKSEDGKLMITCIYTNKFYGKKRPKASDRVELTISVGNSGNK